MSKLKNGTWVLIADGEKALFLENQTDGEDPFLNVVRKEEQENPPNREQAANRRGRFNDGPSVHRSAVEDTDWHQLAKDRFAHELADILYKQAHKGNFDSIVLVADPGTLGELRQELHQEVSDKILGEVPKTLTNHPIDDIEKIVVNELNKG
ncbi:host attachment family protein [Sulfitobacter aestuarii]|uniref:Host attachment family protein n=1 Tax=Sulfitobacter aestuarii TaxID=2161676 RepID=A0ABW5U1P3_9RHOB